MFTKKLFGVAGAALLMVSGAATAQVNLSATAASPSPAIKYASEYVAGTGDNALELVHSGFSVTPDILIPQGSYIRVDLRGAEFVGNFVSEGGSPDVGQLTVGVTPSGPTFREVTRAKDNSFVILEVLNNELPLGTDTTPTVITFKAHDNQIGDKEPFIQVTSTSGTVTAEVKFYDPDDLTEATGNASATLGDEDGAIAMFTPGLKVAVSERRTFTAGVASRFLNFVPGSNATATTATLGTVEVGVNMDVHTPDMVQVQLDNLLKEGSTLTVEGDFTLTEDEEGKQQEGRATLSSATDVDSVNASNSIPGKFAEDGGSIVYTFGETALETVHHLRLTAGGKSAIQESTYDYTLKFAAKNNTVNPEDKSGVFGEIVRDGLSVDIPYITTYSGYNQRLVLTNKSRSRDADYQVEFNTEDGVTYTAGTYARGTVPAGKVMVIKMTDLVTLEADEGKSPRAAGVITFEVPSTTITVATTQVNISDGSGSTDTVVLHPLNR